MRMGELLRSTVVDSDGTQLGRVHDVRLVPDGPELAGFGPALRVDALVVGRGSIAVRLGFHRQGIRGPFLVGRLFRAIEGRALLVPWTDVAEWDATSVRLRAPRSALPLVRDAG
jgi:hypothetical protein